MITSAKIVSLSAEHGLKQKDLILLTNFDKASISKIFKGKIEPPPAKATAFFYLFAYLKSINYHAKTSKSLPVAGGL